MGKALKRSSKKRHRKIDTTDVEAVKEKELDENLKGGPIEQRPNELIFFKEERPKVLVKSKKEMWRNRRPNYEMKLDADLLVQPIHPEPKKSAKPKKKKRKLTPIEEQKQITTTGKLTTVYNGRIHRIIGLGKGAGFGTSSQHEYIKYYHIL